MKIKTHKTKYTITLILAIVLTVLVTSGAMVGLVAGATMGFNENNIAYANWFRAFNEVKITGSLSVGTQYSKASIVNSSAIITDEDAAELLFPYCNTNNLVFLRTFESIELATFQNKDGKYIASLCFGANGSFGYVLIFRVYKEPSNYPQRNSNSMNLKYHFGYSNYDWENGYGIWGGKDNFISDEGYLDTNITHLNFESAICSKVINANAISKYLKFE